MSKPTTVADARSSMMAAAGLLRLGATQSATTLPARYHGPALVGAAGPPGAGAPVWPCRAATGTPGAPGVGGAAAGHRRRARATTWCRPALGGHGEADAVAGPRAGLEVKHGTGGGGEHLRPAPCPPGGSTGGAGRGCPARWRAGRAGRPGPGLGRAARLVWRPGRYPATARRRVSETGFMVAVRQRVVRVGEDRARRRLRLRSSWKAPPPVPNKAPPRPDLPLVVAATTSAPAAGRPEPRAVQSAVRLDACIAGTVLAQTRRQAVLEQPSQPESGRVRQVPCGPSGPAGPPAPSTTRSIQVRSGLVLGRQQGLQGGGSQVGVRLESQLGRPCLCSTTWAWDHPAAARAWWVAAASPADRDGQQGVACGLEHRPEPAPGAAPVAEHHVPGLLGRRAGSGLRAHPDHAATSRWATSRSSAPSSGVSRALAAQVPGLGQGLGWSGRARRQAARQVGLLEDGQRTTPTSPPRWAAGAQALLPSRSSRTATSFSPGWRPGLGSIQRLGIVGHMLLAVGGRHAAGRRAAEKPRLAAGSHKLGVGWASQNCPRETGSRAPRGPRRAGG